MQNTSRSGRHRKASPTRIIAARAALSAGGATAALLVAAGTATAGTTLGAAPADPAVAVAEESMPSPEGPCTNTPLDAIIGPLAQTNCNDPAPASPDDVTGEDPTDEGSGSGNAQGEREGQPASPGVPFPGGGNPPGA